MASEESKENVVPDAEIHDSLVTDGPVYSLEVLAVIKESQQQHGLRHGDYQRYRSYCTRRLCRIRKCVGLLQGSGRSKYVSRPVTADRVKDVRALYIPLVESERCWSYYMQLKSESVEHARKRYHMINKLRKAETHSAKLATLCDEIGCDARTKLEVKAYHVWLSGTVQFELKEWQKALELLKQAKKIYSKLGEALSGELALVYKQKVSDIEPSIRYCAYNIGDLSAADDLAELRAASHADSVLDDLIQKTREKQAASLHEVNWRDRIIPIRNDKVRVFLLSVQDVDAELEAQVDDEGRVEIYERVIKDCVDSLQVTKEELKNDPVFKQIQKGVTIEDRVPAHVLLVTYLQYIKLSQTVGRNLAMVNMYRSRLGGEALDTAPGNEPVACSYKPQDVARLYELIGQNQSEMLSLPGLNDDHEYQSEVEHQIAASKAFRCFYLAKSYQTIKKWPEVVALAKRSSEYSTYAATALTQAEIQAHEQLQADVEEMLVTAQASSILDASQGLSEKLQNVSINSDQRPLRERLDQFYLPDSKLETKSVSLVHLPPDMQPVPCKPKFYDLACSHIHMPDLGPKIAQTQKQAGLTGFMKSWIGGWGGKK